MTVDVRCHRQDLRLSRRTRRGERDECHDAREVLTPTAAQHPEESQGDGEADPCLDARRARCDASVGRYARAALRSAPFQRRPEVVVLALQAIEPGYLLRSLEPGLHRLCKLEIVGEVLIPQDRQLTTRIELLGRILA